MRNHIYKFLLFSFFCLSAQTVWAQRTKIDNLAKEHRKGFKDMEALIVARKMIELDSTYYRGYHFEGAYRYLRASDKRGFKSAVKPLEKAVELMEKDFGWQLVRYTNIQYYIKAYERQKDYCFLINLLKRSYQNLEMPREAVKTARRLIDKKLIYEFNGSPYSDLAWIYHRNRMYSEKYDFLEPTIEENVRKGMSFLDSIERTNQKNVSYIQDWFRNPRIFDYMWNEIYHNKAVFYSYLLEIDSAELFSRKQMDLGMLSDNNYGILQFIKGDFTKAEEYFKKEKSSATGDAKKFKEYDYMLACLENFKGKPEKGIEIMQATIAEAGPTPGYGWYNMALARSYYYNGEVKKFGTYQERAGNFEDLHIGTSHGEEMYERSKLVLKYLHLDQQMKAIQFEDDLYWLKPKKLFRLAELYLERKSTHLLLTGHLASDPEREMVTYNIFASENLIFFDEIWEAIKDFNADFFINTFEEKIETDERESIKKYFRYLIAKFHLSEGDTEKASEYFQLVLADKTLNPETEKLLIARTHEALAELHDEENNETEKDKALLEFYKSFPQLVPFAKTRMKMQLDLKYPATNEFMEIEEAIRGINVKWQEKSGDDFPTASIIFEKKEQTIFAKISVEAEGKELLKTELVFKGEVSNLAEQVVYAIFKIQNSEKDEENAEVEEIEEIDLGV
jgi:hypothetical protein